MVFILVFLTVAVCIALNYFLQREERALKATEKKKKSPIFLSPDKALLPVKRKGERFYHPSHSWVQKEKDDIYYVGFDDLISFLFSDHIKLKNLPLIGASLPQGSPIWDVSVNGHHILQLAPVSGEVVDVNPACCLDMPLPSDQVEKSWILKIKAEHFIKDANNLMSDTQADIMNNSIRDEIFSKAVKGNYVNDGGKLAPEFVENMSEEDWHKFIQKYFPHQEKTITQY